MAIIVMTCFVDDDDDDVGDFDCCARTSRYIIASFVSFVVVLFFFTKVRMFVIHSLFAFSFFVFAILGLWLLFVFRATSFLLNLFRVARMRVCFHAAMFVDRLYEPSARKPWLTVYRARPSGW